jgi:protocatechuate 3,4-dioxygenase beta subunit
VAIAVACLCLVLTPSLAFGNVTTSDMTYHDGPVMPGPSVHLVFWSPSTLQDGTTPATFDQSYISGLEQFFKDVGGHGLDNVMGQYAASDGTTPTGLRYGDTFVDHTAFPHQGCTPFGIGNQNCLNDQQLRDELEHLRDHGAPSDANRGLHDLYFVFLPKGENLCTNGSYDFGLNKHCFSQETGGICAYHDRDTFLFGPDIYYAALPFVATQGGCRTPDNPNGPDVDPEINTASHELFEAVTDPQTSAPITPNGWYGPGGGDDEVADKCNFNFGGSGNSANVFDNGQADEFWNGHYYEIQGEWSNRTHGCVWQDDRSPIDYRAGCSQSSLAPNDDGSTGRVALPFDLNFFASTYSGLYVNNNGNVTFGGPLPTYTPFGLTATETPIIAPFFADVDTRGPGSGFVTYGEGGTPGDLADPPYFCVDWFDVGYYGNHTDRTNSFQLVLYDRSAQTGHPGDFDIVFNYDRIRWETGDASGGSGGLGGSSARVGYSNGTSRSAELAGSGTNGALLDGGPNSLISASVNSTQLGRYIFPVRSNTTGTGGFEGMVTDDATPPTAVAGATLQFCTVGSPAQTCAIATTNTSGNYSLNGLPAGDYDVRVSPPTSLALFEKDLGPYRLDGTRSVHLDIALSGPHAPPPGTTITSLHTNPDGTPVLDWDARNTLTTQGCSGGSASYRITIANNQYGSPVSGSMSEAPTGSGSYTASIPPLRPQYGPASVVISITCPNPAQNETIRFSVYIDPAGSVLDTNGHPVAGATVTLYRADSASGPFTRVPAGSSVMSPANRANPDTTTAAGRFGWDVLAGFYKIRAAKAGCTAPTDPSASYVETPVESIPPAIDNLTLTLSCQRNATHLSLVPKVSADQAGTPHSVTATATDALGRPVARVSIVFRVNGANSAHRTVLSDSHGHATFTYPGTRPGEDTISAFADNNLNGRRDGGEPTDTATEIWFGLLINGSFVIGDRGASVGDGVTFWGARWSTVNRLSDGGPPSSFEGFASRTGTNPARCSASWSTRSGDSASPPTGPLPAYMPVIVSSSITRSGATISGNIWKVVVIKTDPGYAADPGHTGTGRVVAQICEGQT